MSKGLSPTQRTLHAQRQLGRVCAIAERWQINPRHPAGGFRKDLFGFIDVIALDPERAGGSGIVAIQSCGSSFAQHRRKLLEEECSEAVREWLRCGGHVELWSWTKRKVKRGGSAVRWMPRIHVFTLADFLAEGAEWRDVEGYEGLYQVSDTGGVRSLERQVEDQMANGVRTRTVKGRMLSPGQDSHGYLQVQLYRDKDGGRMHLVHRLVAKAFVPNPDGKPQVNHLDGSPKNNQAENLEWATSSEDSLHATRTLGRVRGRTILTYESAEEIRRLYDQGESQDSIAERFGVRPSTVSNVVSGRRWPPR